MKLLTPQALLARLERRLPLLTGGSRELPAFQQTLRGTIEWSHDLLEGSERRLFARLAVFAGGWKLEAAEAVYREEGLDVIEGLASLLDNSLVRQHVFGDGEIRFAMLATIREFALERLEASGEAEAVRRRHSEYFLEVAERTAEKLSGALQARWLEALARDLENIRAALTWTADAQEPEMLLRLATSLWRFWIARGHLREANRWLSEALARGANQPPRLRAPALYALASVASSQGDVERGSELSSQGLALYRELDDTSGVAKALSVVADCVERRGDRGRARSLREESVELFRHIGDKQGLAIMIGNLGYAAFKEGDLERAMRLTEQTVAIQREIGDLEGLAVSLQNLAFIGLVEGRYEEATPLLEEALALAEELGYALVVVYCLEGIARAAAVRGDAPQAARLLGATETALDSIGAMREEAEAASRTLTLATVREHLGDATLGAVTDEGRALSLVEATAEGRRLAATLRARPADAETP
jgi:tetratricopeptide (TPR) repeat protein